MYTVERRHSLCFQVPGNAFVRRKHEFLNDAIRDVAFRARNALHQPKLVEFDHRLRKIEVNGSAPFALAIEDHLQFAHQLEVRHQPGVTRLE